MLVHKYYSKTKYEKQKTNSLEVNRSFYNLTVEKTFLRMCKIQLWGEKNFSTLEFIKTFTINMLKKPTFRVERKNRK